LKVLKKKRWDLLNETVMITSSNEEVTGLMAVIWWFREDLQKIFSLTSDDEINGYIGWYRKYAKDHYGFPNWLSGYIKTDDASTYSGNKYIFQNLIDDIWRENKDLQAKYDITDSKDLSEFLIFLLKAGNRGEQISPWIILQAGREVGLNIHYARFLTKFIFICIKMRGLYGILNFFSRDISMLLSSISIRSRKENDADNTEKKCYSPPDVNELIIKRDGEEFAINKEGLNLIGYPFEMTGIGEDIRASIACFNSQNVNFKVLDFNKAVNPKSINIKTAENKFMLYDVNLICMTALETFRAFMYYDHNRFNDCYSIGYWHWELPEWPDGFVPLFSFIDEVWASSEYEYNCLESKATVPVVHMPQCVVVPDVKNYTRRYFDLPEEPFLFTFSFNFSSYISRKNPMACLEAFIRAFPKGDESVGLVIQAVNSSDDNIHWQKVTECASKDNRIFIINKELNRDEMWGLLKVCNAFLSLHRAEGFGRIPAEAMALGKPVIVTNFSGNTDFTHEHNSCIVNFSLIDVDKNEYAFGEGQKWADPDIEHAAWYMDKLVNDGEYALMIGKAGEETIKEKHNPNVIGRRYVDRLKKIGLL